MIRYLLLFLVDLIIAWVLFMLLRQGHWQAAATAAFFYMLRGQADIEMRIAAVESAVSR